MNLLDVFAEAQGFANLDNGAALQEIKRLEAMVDEAVSSRTLSQETAWDMYFGLMHECDERGFLDDFRRIVSKIDVSRYNPLQSKNSGVRFLAQLRLSRLTPAAARN